VAVQAVPCEPVFADFLTFVLPRFSGQFEKIRLTAPMDRWPQGTI